MKGIHVNANSGPNYAPSRFEAHSLAGGITKNAFRSAMRRLLESSKIESVPMNRGSYIKRILWQNALDDTSPVDLVLSLYAPRYQFLAHSTVAPKYLSPLNPIVPHNPVALAEGSWGTDNVYAFPL